VEIKKLTQDCKDTKNTSKYSKRKRNFAAFTVTNILSHYNSIARISKKVEGGGIGGKK